ncbi:MAG: hypothetical protein WBA57_22235 [Elainellaceae cyanobacterium]
MPDSLAQGRRLAIAEVTVKNDLHILLAVASPVASALALVLAQFLWV